jgi:hypothetical protein
MFSDRLRVTVKLTLAGTAHTIPAGNVRRLELELASYGFSGRIEFWLAADKAYGGGYEDELKAAFIKPDLIQVDLAVEAAHAEPETAASIQPIAVSGLVTSKALTESQLRTERDEPIVGRRYEVRFADPARVLWGQHYPCELYTEKSMQDVLDAHKGERITLAYDWTALGASQPLLFLGLDPAYGASFYDLVLWYVASGQAAFTYDYLSQGAQGSGSPGYKIAATKDTTGTPAKLFRDDVARLALRFPEVVRYQARVLNSYALSPATQIVDQEQKVTGIRQDHLLHTPISQAVDDRVSAETARLFVRGMELELECGRYPTITFVPGVRLTLESDLLWSSQAVPLGQTYRVFEVRLVAEALVEGLDQDYGAPDTGFRVSLAAALELDAEKTLRLPAFAEPRYPVYVEGLVVSEQGEEADETYQIYQDQSTSQDQYKVAIPLWEKQQVTAPFGPGQGSDRLYFPLHKNDRVLVAFDFAGAEIVKTLDWRAGARLAMEGQGDQVLFGKTPTSKTAMSFLYTEQKPVFSIARTNDKDTSTIELKEGILRIVVKEDT